MPTAVKERLQAAGKDPADPAVVQELYEGMFRRIAKTHPLDYYWLWTPEDWTWKPVPQPQIDATMADFRAVLAAAKKVKPPFTLATCGWVLGPPQTPALFDEFLPKDMPMSCINRQVGNTPVEPGFAKVQGRPKWAIPWLEDDPGLTMPQLWAGRMRRDAADALKYGCTGLMGIHWRTRILGPNVSALAQAAWDQTGWNESAKDRCRRQVATCRRPISMPIGPGRSSARKRPSRSPRSSPAWTATCRDLPIGSPAPAASGPTRALGKQVREQYAFVDEMAVLRPRIEGPGNLERFDYWLNNFRCLRSIAEVRCVWARFNAALVAVKAEKDPETQKKLARELVLPLRKELVAAFAELHRHLLATVNNPGEMGNVCNWQQQTLPAVLDRAGRGVGQAAGRRLARRRHAVETICGPAAAVRARGSHEHYVGRAATIDRDHAGRQAAPRPNCIGGRWAAARLPKRRWFTSLAACIRSSFRPKRSKPISSTSFRPTWAASRWSFRRPPRPSIKP